MQLQFQKTVVSSLDTLRSGVWYQELTQELRLPEQMPDVGNILGAWGQVLIRSKEWRSGSVSVSGGVMVWAMYRPEDGTPPQMVEAWIPFQMKWDLPETQYDGSIRVSPLLKNVDARVTSARKVMLRCCVALSCEASAPMNVDVFSPQQVPEGVYLLERTYPMLLAKEVGEKSFSVEEELALPASAPPVEKLLRFSFHPELIDQKMMAGKVVFRGVGLIHILYLSADGQLCSCDLQAPFSQYSELEGDYDQDASADIWMALTALEMDMDDRGQLLVKAGLTGQYKILTREMIRVAEDAYAAGYKITPQTEQLCLPTILEEQTQLLQAHAAGKEEGLRPIDVAFYPDQPQMSKNEMGFSMELGGCFQVLGYDANHELVGSVQRWSDTISLSCSDECSIQPYLQCSAQPRASDLDDTVSSDLVLRTVTVVNQAIPMLTGIELEEKSLDPGRPSLILRRVGEETLWTIAKENGSTELAIRQANGLSGEPEAGQILLIPVI